MPLYSYSCEKCGKVEDRLVKFSEAENQFCDCAENQPVVRSEKIETSSFVLKGRWYKTTRGY